MSAETRFIVGAMNCGCRVAVSVDDGTDLADVAEDIRRMKRNGYTVTAENGPEYRANPVKHCVHKPRQAKLPESGR
jgi:hypothetical protein